MRGTRGFATWLIGALALVLPSSALANHQPGDFDVKVFKATIDASGTFTGTGGDQSGGSWTMSASPFWKVVYPGLTVPLDGDEDFRPAPEYAFSGTDAGPITWSGTAQYDFTTAPPEGFSCTASLLGPQTAGPPQGFAPHVRLQGQDVKLELPALNQFGPFGSQGACTPQASSFAVGWAITLGNNTEVFSTIPAEEVFEDDSITKNVQFGSGNALPICTYGCTSANLQWQGTLKLEKTCRDFAGTAKTYTSGTVTVTNPFCESDCNVSDCAQADLELIPLASAAKEDGGEVDFTVSCYGEQTCNGTEKLLTAGGKRASTLGSGTFSVEPAAHAMTTVTLSRAGMKALKKQKKVKATLKSTITGDEVAEANDSLRVTIKR